MSTRHRKSPAVRLRHTLTRMTSDVTRFGRARRRTVLPQYDLSDAKRRYRRAKKSRRGRR